MREAHRPSRRRCWGSLPAPCAVRNVQKYGDVVCGRGVVVELRWHHHQLERPHRVELAAAIV